MICAQPSAFWRTAWGLAVAVGAWVFAFFPGLVRAHDPGLSTAQVEVRSDSLTVVTGFAPADVEALLPPAAPRAGKWGQEEFEAVETHLNVLAPLLWEVSAAGASLRPDVVRVQLLPEDNVSFTLVYLQPVREAGLTLRAPKLADLPSMHRQFVMVSNASGLALMQKLLSAKDNVLEVPVATWSNADSPDAQADGTAPFWRFLVLGVEHIWTGYDHLLFLLALLVVCRSFRSIVAIITCFTLAHSLTLALATFDLVSLPSRWVEAAIAASIVFVGVENLWRRGAEPRGRWALTFCFGLVHGFGFASVLRDLGVGAGTAGVLMPLFSFNLGVELGQIAVAALVLPVVWRLGKAESFVRYGLPAISLAVTLAGLYWLLERTVFA